MSGLFQGLEIGKRALLTHQLSMSVIGHNVANVNTPGYTRQRTLVTSAVPIETANYIIGNGVTARTVNQVRDLFLTSQFRRESKSLGQWTYLEKALGQIETFFAEPDDRGLGETLNKFWAGWLDLSNNPESMAARSAVVSQANLLVNAFHTLDGQLREMRAAADVDVAARVGEINQYAAEIANLNRLVVSEELGQQKANDLRDQRDLLIDQLSQMVDVSTAEKANGAVTVYISGLAIVENADTFQIGTREVASDDQTRHEIVWKNTKSAVKITGGELKGLLDTRDAVIPDYLKQLDQLAGTIVRRVNEIHRAGTDLNGNTGMNFFNPAYVDAGTIQLQQEVADDPTRIGASLSGQPGDNANALAISELRDRMTMAYGTTSVTEYYNTMISSVGVASHEAKTFKGNFEVLIQQIENSRQSVQGVSLDEEMAEMVKMQHAYDAAARLITFVDQALETLIHGMGVVGR
jgi:flagellar hook-associated protein 1 FlgK